MSDMTSLTIKIPVPLKEQLREYAEQEQESLSRISEQLLLSALENRGAAELINAEEVDNQHIQEAAEPEDAVLTAKEIKALKKLLKKKKG